MILLAAQTGLRASELTALRIADTELGTGAHVTTLGKGTRTRITPLTNTTVATLRGVAQRTRRRPERPAVPDPDRRRAHPRRARPPAHEIRRCTPRRSCPSLRAKTITPHVLRHTAAMRLLHAGIDTSVIALWLGHAAHPNHPDLPPRRPRAQRTSTRENHTDRQQTRPLPAARHAPRVPRSTLTPARRRNRRAGRRPPTFLRW